MQTVKYNIKKTTEITRIITKKNMVNKNNNNNY